MAYRVLYSGPEVGYTCYVLRPGDPYRWENDWLIGLDDGFFKMGISRSYTALTTGDYSGTTNITVNGKTEAKSNACVQDERTGLMWSKTPSGSVGPSSDGCLHWDDHVDVITHDGANGGYVAGELLTEAVTGETAQIRYVDDANNKLGVVNPSTRPFGLANTISSPSGGPDTPSAWAQGAKEDIWSYVAAANKAEYAGHSDWRIPNLFEVLSIMYYSATNTDAEPDNSYFTMPADLTKVVWTSSHEGAHDRRWQPTGFDPDNADAVRFDTGYIYSDNTAWKCDVTGYTYLVRGPDTENYPCRQLRTGNYSPAAGSFPDDARSYAGVARSWTYFAESTTPNVYIVARDGTSFAFPDYWVEDNLTGLMWTMRVLLVTPFGTPQAIPYYDPDGQRFDAIDAVRLVNESTQLPYNDWRIPNLYEVATLMTGSIRDVAWILSDSSRGIWTCTPDPNDTDKVFHTELGSWFDVASRSTVSKFLRLVRGGTTSTSIELTG